MTEEIPLPPMQDAVLDTATLEQLFFDLANVADVLEVKLKADPTRHASGEQHTLESALTALVNRSVAGAQIHYRHGNAEWTDTLMPGPAGFRLVRIQHTAPCGMTAASAR